MNARRWIATIVGCLLVGSAAQAVFPDPLFCEAKLLAAESRYYLCLARCDRRFVANDGFNVERCETRCQNAMDSAVGRIERKPRCRPPEPDPNLCEARLLKIESQHMSCKSRCDRRNRRLAEFDMELCGTTCDETADTATSDTMSSAICGEGRINGDDE